MHTTSPLPPADTPTFRVQLVDDIRSVLDRFFKSVLLALWTQSVDSKDDYKKVVNTLQRFKLCLLWVLDGFQAHNFHHNFSSA